MEKAQKGGSAATAYEGKGINNVSTMQTSGGNNGFTAADQYAWLGESTNNNAEAIAAKKAQSAEIRRLYPELVLEATLAMAKAKEEKNNELTNHTVVATMNGVTVTHKFNGRNIFASTPVPVVAKKNVLILNPVSGTPKKVGKKRRLRIGDLNF